MTAKLCLNMIVKNEGDRIFRALDAAKPFITTFAILDTGSTDDTISKVLAWSAANQIRGHIAMGDFHNFSQARNDALRLARHWYAKKECPPFSYILLQDADMELVGDVSALDQIGGGDMYEMLQTSGGISYYNPRILSVHSPAIYVGVTHEHLAIGPSGQIIGLTFKDHADGANRVHKFERDIRLLEEDLKTDPNNARSWFYLGNSYRDAGQHSKALAAYTRRMELGGWDEENYATQCYIAGCHRELGGESNFVTEMLKAHEIRPQRGEALYDLAQHYRVKGMNATAMVFVEAGIGLPRPDDRLFVNDFVHTTGFREEYSIAGFYQESTREKAYRITNGLALDPSVPHDTRWGARRNMVFYLPKIKAVAPSAEHTQLVVAASPGYVAMNPSICNRPDGDLEVLVRTVNYRINAAGQYMIGELGCQDAPIVTENHIVQLRSDLQIHRQAKVSWDRPPAQFPLVIGLEDMRIFWYQGERRFVACIREQSASGQCEQHYGKLEYRFPGTAFVSEWERISDGTTTEKNWGPMVRSPDLFWVYRLDEIILPDGGREHFACKYAVDNISGSSQWIEWRGGYLSVVHEAIYHPSTGKRVYQHRFAFFDRKLASLQLSLPFTFQDTQIEFCAGIAKHPTSAHLIVSYGVRDEEAWMTKIAEIDVAAMLFGV